MMICGFSFNKKNKKNMITVIENKGQQHKLQHKNIVAK